MHTTGDTALTALLRHVADNARMAPSIHNTQPWHFERRGDAFELYAAPERGLDVIDRSGRQLTLSCGCALFNARVTFAAAGLATRVERLPDPDVPELLARIRLIPGPSPADLAGLASAIPQRRTNRRRFAEDGLPATILGALMASATSEGTQLLALHGHQRAVVTRLCREADNAELLDPAYRAELRAWTTDDPQRRDGVPAHTAPHVSALSAGPLAMRDFDVRGNGRLPAAPTGDHNLFLLTTGQDRVLSWLQSGEALERIWLQATQHDLAVSLFSQPIELRAVREKLRQELGSSGHPQLVLRIGRANPTPPVPRLTLSDVFTEPGSS